MRRLGTVVAITAALAAAGTGTAGAGTGANAGADHRGGADYVLRAQGEFERATGSGTPRAITYDRTLVPEGARVVVTQHAGTKGQRISVAVKGVKADHTFGTHVHTGSCAADPAAAGPHYQNVKDPHPPSMDPKYANRYNEVWLDFHSTRYGGGRQSSVHPWTFRTGEARSVVLHERATSTKPGEAGMAGARVACFTVPFLSAAR